MNRIILFLMTALLLLSLTACTGNDKVDKVNTKVLVVYYSHTYGNTKALAKQIQNKFKGELAAIKLEASYPVNEDETIELVKHQLDEEYLPPIKNTINIEPYEFIFVGSPIWFGTGSLPVWAFLESNDFTGKTIIPFYTSGTGGVGSYAEDLQARCPGATVWDAFGHTREDRDKGMHVEKMEEYLDSLNIAIKNAKSK